MDIHKNIEEVRRRIAEACVRSGRSSEEVMLVAITKTVGVELIQQAFAAGIRHFGENRVQEAKEKIAVMRGVLDPPPTWHMVGHLQTNKVKTAVTIFDIIHSIDSVRLAEIVNERVQQPFPVLIEVNVAGEASKSGFALEETVPAVERIRRLGNLEVKGLMTVAPMVNDPEEVRPVFRRLRELRDALGLEHLSMGMTDDFEVAIEEGATMVRIGRAIFGERR